MFRNVESYLNEPTTRDILGIDSASGNWSSHNNAVTARFEANADRVSFRAEDSIGALLERGVRARGEPGDLRGGRGGAAPARPGLEGIEWGGRA